jgi:hypothetical protein
MPRLLYRFAVIAGWFVDSDGRGTAGFIIIVDRLASISPPLETMRATVLLGNIHCLYPFVEFDPWRERG